MEKIWCLFSVDNNYDQPENNLVTWWAERPSLETLAAGLGRSMEDMVDEAVVALVAIWQGTPTRMPHNDTRYRLQPWAEGHVQP